MILIRRSEERGHFDHGWLDTYHTFSFGDYHDPAFMGFRTLRVINEDVVQPGRGFGMHGHRDMEILTYVLAGELEHRDSLGNRGVIRPGEVQVMTAGTGIRHAEINPSPTDAVHLLQVWILPERPGLTPRYDQRVFSVGDPQSGPVLIASADSRDGSLEIHQDARVYVQSLNHGQETTHTISPTRSTWVQVARGEIELNGQRLSAGDGAAIRDESNLIMRGIGEGVAEWLLFDLG